jgi:RNA polymerase sigma-70 factor (ECF subfamily)
VDPAATEVDRLLEQAARRHRGQLVATLTRILGAGELGVIEDLVQQAFLRAVETWRRDGAPRNAFAWLVQAGRNHAVDLLRRDALLRRKEAEVRSALGLEDETGSDPADARAAGSALDDTLAMTFLCCHPEVPEDARVALTLKAVAGFDTAAIARAFLAEEATIAQRLVRAKRRIRERRIELALPEGPELGARLGSVLQVLYLVFNEGYAAHRGESLVRLDLCEEAIRLAGLVASHPSTAAPRSHALVALFCLHAARLPSRVDDGGNLLLLAEQDRGLWDRALIARGLDHLERSAAGEELSVYHLEAGIAACHAIAPSYAATDWPHILELYDALLEVEPTPVVALNRAVALSRVSGPEAGIHAVEALRTERPITRTHLYWATLAALHAEKGDREAAASFYRAALELPCSEPERRFLAERLAATLA